MARKAATQKAETETTATVESVEVKPVEMAEEPVENVKPAKRTRKTTAKKATAETAEKKTTTVKKTTTRRTTKKAAKTVNTEVFVQFWGKEVFTNDVVEGIKRIWVEEMGKKEEEIEDLKIYIKPEDNGAHYVINGSVSGFFAL